ncbi:MAG TPA: hypothetical protein VNE39_08815 [Planctomycetota bacterium]|nr:hypothetical protein [Planctomycetota bacterium]
MDEVRSLQAFEHWRDANQRFDYFVMGMTGALCAYIAQSWVPRRISVSPSTAELVALLLLAASVYAGFRRAQEAIHTFAIAHQRIRLSERRGKLLSNLSDAPLMNPLSGEVFSRERAEELIDAWGEAIPRLGVEADATSHAAGRWARARNRFLFVGFLLLLAARVWSAYV